MGRPSVPAERSASPVCGSLESGLFTVQHRRSIPPDGRLPQPNACLYDIARSNALAIFERSRRSASHRASSGPTCRGRRVPTFLPVR